MILPDLDKMSDVEAIHWYTGEVLRLIKERNTDPDYHKELMEWKEKMNQRLKEDKKKKQ